MAAASSPLRRASNTLVIVLLILFAFYLVDAIMTWFGAAPFFACSVFPAWLEISDPIPLLVMVAALVLWFMTRSPLALVLFIFCLVVGVTPWLLLDVVDACQAGASAAPINY